jgi:quercetin dioxygenase-like cupin family protein
MENKMKNDEIFPIGKQLPGEWFSGNAYLSPLVTKDKNNDFSAGSITFEPRARTNWHTHPRGQVLLITEGRGYYQEKGKAAREIQKGDVVIIPENVEHRHGASVDDKMIHIAITNYKEDLQVTWLQPVTDAEYNSVITK